MDEFDEDITQVPIKPKRLTRLRTRLLMLILLVLVPPLLLMTYTAQRQGSAVADAVQQEALRFAESVAGTQEQISENAEHLLIALAQLPAVQQGNTEVCSALFADLLKEYERYTNIFSVDMNGKTICTGIPSDVSLDASGSPWFLQTLETGTFQASDYKLGIVSQRPLVTYSYPVIAASVDRDVGADSGASGEIRYILGIGLDLNWLSSLIADLSLPSGSHVIAVDRQGVILYGYPESVAATGTAFQDETLLHSERRSGTIESTGIDGVSRLFGFTRLKGNNGSTTILVGLPEEYAILDNNRLFVQNVLGLVIVGAIFLLIAWVGIDLLLVQPVTILVRNAHRLTEGDLKARIDLNTVKDTYELTELAQAFNEMAQAQQIRQMELERARDNSEYRVKLRSRELGFLVEVSKIVASSLDYETTLRTVAAMTIPQLADWCIIHVVEEGQLKLVALAHADPERLAWAEELARRYPLFQQASPSIIVDKRPKVYHDDESLNGLYDRLAQSPEHRQLMQEAGITSIMSLPLLLRENAAGMLTLAFAGGGKHYDLQHLWLAIEIARLAAVSIDNTHLYREARLQEERLRKLNSELDVRVEERTRQLSAVNQELEAFSYSVSHDLRTPLRAIDGFSQALVEDYGDKLDGEALNYLHRVRSATQRMGNLIDDLLKLSRLSRGEIEFAPLDLSKIAHEVIGELRAADPHRQVEIKIEDNLVARGDVRLLYIVMQNLLGNAWKFSGKCEQARIEFGAVISEGQQAYCVRDNGAGFEMAYVNKLFGAFQRLHRVEDFDGNGIGLATVQRIIHRHEGRVWAQGKPGQGATFYFTLTDNRLN